MKFDQDDCVSVSVHDREREKERDMEAAPRMTLFRMLHLALDPSTKKQQ